MADDFGLKIGLEGEKAFKDALRDINQSFKVLGSEMKLVSSEFDKNDKSVAALTSRNTVLNKEIETQKDKVSTLQAALQNSAESFGENDRRTQAWQIQLNNATAELNNMEREAAANEKAIDEMSGAEGDAADNTDKLDSELKEAGATAEDSGGKFDSLKGILVGVGVAVGAAFAAIGTATVAASKALADMTVGASQYADDMLTMSTVTGVSAESLQAYNYAAELVDVSMETLTGSMSKNVKSMNSAREGTGAAADAYKTLGVSVTDSNGGLRDSETVYWDAIDALGKMTNETERDALAMQIFGKSARDLNPLIMQGSAGIAELTDEARAMGAVMSGDMLDAFGNFDDSMQRLSAGGSAAKNALGTLLLPQLQILADSGVSLLGEFTSGILAADGDWTKIGETISGTIGSIVQTVNEQLPQMMEMGMNMVMAIGGAISENIGVIVDCASQIVGILVQGLTDALPGIIEGAAQILLALVNGIISALPALVGAAAQIISQLASGIGAALPQLIPAAVSAVVAVVTTLLDNLPMILDAALSIITGLTQGILDALPVLIAALPEIITSILDFLVASIPKIIEAGVQLLVSLVTALPEIIATIIAVIPQIIASIVTAVIQLVPMIVRAGIDLLVSLIQALPEIIQAIIKAIPIIVEGIVNALINNIDKIIIAGIDLFIALITALPTIIVEVVKAVPQIITGIVTAFASFIPKMAEIGTNLLKGVWQGLSNAAEWLWNQVKGLFTSLTNKIKNFFGIASPSKMFAGIGTNLAEGLGVGFEKTMDGVSRDMQDAIPSSFDTSVKTSVTADMVNGLVGGLSGVMGGSSGQPIILQVNLDGRIIAQTIFDPLRDVGRQRGVALG